MTKEPEKPTTACDRCGEEAVGEFESWDSCPTDRGEEIRWYSVPLCGECAAKRKGGTQ